MPTAFSSMLTMQNDVSYYVYNAHRSFLKLILHMFTMPTAVSSILTMPTAVSYYVKNAHHCF